MKTMLLHVLLVVSSSILGASRPGDGIYLPAADDSGPPVVGQDGRTVHLGAKQALEIQSSELYALDNANTQFYLSLRVPYDEDRNRPWYILVADDIAFRQTEGFGSAGRFSGLSFQISEKKYAEQVARYLAIPVVYREHPGYALRVVFVPKKKEFRIGDDLAVTLRIENVGAKTIAFRQGGRNRAMRDNQYVFAAYYRGEPVKDIGTTIHFGGLFRTRSLRPGEVFEDTVSLSKWFVFDQAGPYELHGAYYLAFYDPEGDRRRTIWEDHASADFTVTVVEPD